jgi:hypothetical protein
VPVSKCPQLDNVLANLELMPLKLNIRKSDSVGARQTDLLMKLQAAGLLELRVGLVSFVVRPLAIVRRRLHAASDVIT